MKQYLVLFLFLSAFVNVTLAQAPGSFQYQSVVRDAGGNPVTNQNVSFEVDIRMGPPLGTIVYTETHQVTTNSFGIASLAIGAGNVVMGDFSTINWSTGNWFVTIGIDITGGTSYVNMGSTKLLSVPYALYAQEAANGFSGNYNDLTGAPTGLSAFNNDTGYITSPDDADADPTNELQILSVSNDTLFLSNGGFVALSNYVDTLWNKTGNDIYNTNSGKVGIGTTTPPGKLVVQGDTSLADTIPLFEVKDRTGATVFVVYPDSVRIFINDDNTKTNKGAFAVSGRNTAKAITNDFFWVTPDSVRVFLDSVSAAGGFAVESFGGANNHDFFSVSLDTSQVIDPSEPRVVWYPTKAALLSGRVLIQHPDSVGINSFATGFEARARGNWSQAMGFKTVSRGNYSTAIGRKTYSVGYNSFAIGDSTVASGDRSFAFGYGSRSNGVGSIALGTEAVNQSGVPNGLFTIANGNYSLAAGMGANTSVNALGAIAIGSLTQADGIASSSIGCNNQASGLYASAIGTNNKSQGIYTLAVGSNDTVVADGAMAIGFNNLISGGLSMAIGADNTISGVSSAAIGFSNIASGNFSQAIGFYVSTNGQQGAILLGDYSSASAYMLADAPNQFKVRASGGYVFHSDPSLSVMNTVYISPLTGNMGLGINNPARKLHVKDVMRLEPRNAPPPLPWGEGDIYYDLLTHKLMVYNGTEWMACW